MKNKKMLLPVVILATALDMKMISADELLEKAEIAVIE